MARDIHTALPHHFRNLIILYVNYNKYVLVQFFNMLISVNTAFFQNEKAESQFKKASG